MPTRHGPRRIRVTRRGYVNRKGERVSPTYVPPTSFRIRDRGLSGRGPKYFDLKMGGLSGWSHTQESATRHEHLKRVAEKDGWLTVFHRLDALSKLDSRVSPHTSEIARTDANWARKHLRH